MSNLNNNGIKAIQLIGVALIVIVAGCPSDSGVEDTPVEPSIQSLETSTQSQPPEKIESETPTPILWETDMPAPITTQEPEQTPQSTSTAVLSPTPTVTPTPTPVPPYGHFKSLFTGGLKDNAFVPLRIRGAEIVNETLFVVLNATAPSIDQELHDLEWFYLARSYTSAIHTWDSEGYSGKVPKKMIALDINKSTYDGIPNKFVVYTDHIREYSNGTISNNEFTRRWQNSTGQQTDRQREIARNLDYHATNVTYHRNSSD